MTLRNPSNADLLRQFGENAKQHDELKADIKAIKATLDTLAPVIAAHEERLKMNKEEIGALQVEQGWQVKGIIGALALGLLTFAGLAYDFWKGSGPKGAI